MGPPGSDAAFYDGVRDSPEGPYLSADDLRGGSGFRGDAGRWERARRPIASAVDRDGTFLDVGCANGLLVESLVAWTGEDGRRIEPYGLDLIPSLAALARKRLPRWKSSISVGNVMHWEPPFRFDFVRTEPRYVPRDRRRELVERLLGLYLVPGGRLILCSYNSFAPINRGPSRSERPCGPGVTTSRANPKESTPTASSSPASPGQTRRTPET